MQEPTGVSGTLRLNCGRSLYLESELEFELGFYEGGVARVYIGKPGRFRTAKDVQGVLREGLVEVEAKTEVLDEGFVSRLGEGAEVRVQRDPFRLEYSVGQELLLKINEHDTLFFESFQGFQEAPYS